MSARTPLAVKKRSLAFLRVGGLVVLLGASLFLWNDLPLLGAVAGTLLLLLATGLYLVEARYARALERLLARGASAR